MCLCVTCVVSWVIYSSEAIGVCVCIHVLYVVLCIEEGYCLSVSCDTGIEWGRSVEDVILSTERLWMCAWFHTLHTNIHNVPLYRNLYFISCSLLSRIRGSDHMTWIRFKSQFWRLWDLPDKHPWRTRLAEQHTLVSKSIVAVMPIPLFLL